MNWFLNFIHDHQSMATSIFLIAAVAVTGLFLGSISIKKVSLGIGGVIFSGIIFGHFGLAIDHTVLDFCRDFGLILFVYAIGLSVGPGIVDAIKSDGIVLNICAASVVFLGVVLTISISCFTNISPAISVGMFSGGVTNTPSLAAGSQAIQDMVKANKVSPETAYEATIQVDPTKIGSTPLSDLSESKKNEMLNSLPKIPGLGYAVAYPFGVIGTIMSMLLLKSLFRTNSTTDNKQSPAESVDKATLEVVNLSVENPNLFGKRIKEIPALSKMSVVISRLMHDGIVQIAYPHYIVAKGDVLLAVGTKEDLEQLETIVGTKASIDLRSVATEITTRRLIVTNKNVVGKKIGELQILTRLGVKITRIRRADVEFAPNSNVTLHYADSVVAVGTPEAVIALVDELGDSKRQLEHPDVIVLFIGMLLGVLLGSIPLQLPGVPAPVRLGMAGGPLLVAILLSRVKRIGRAVSYMPNSAKIILRELGIVLFLSAVGIKAGDNFFSTLIHGNGLKWMLFASMITLIPVLIVGSIAHYRFKLNFATICGLIAGSMTDPPALSFAQNTFNSDAVVISYAAVYPVTMILRIVSAQIIVMILL